MTNSQDAAVTTPPVNSGFVPGEADLASVQEWFERYDALVLSGDVEAMADQAVFPLNTVTDDATGNGLAQQCGREEFIADMRQTVGAAGDLRMESTRTPHFLTESLVFVITEATMTVHGQSFPVRYGDLLVKVDGDWKFQTMVQGGWG